MTTVAAATRVSLELGCSPECDEFAGPLLLQLGGGRYDECAVLPVPADVGEWRARHRTARKRADRAARRGYQPLEFARERRVDEIHAINVSAPVRQRRPMSAGYHQRPSETPLPVFPCGRHGIAMHGVVDRDERLVAYLTLYRCGDLRLVSQILGHADHLDNEVMYLLFQGVVEWEAEVGGGGWFVYNRWDSGTDGLRWFKERLGFEPMLVDWQP